MCKGIEACGYEPVGLYVFVRVLDRLGLQEILVACWHGINSGIHIPSPPAV